MSISSLQSLLLFNSYYMNSVRKIHGNGQVGSAENKLEEHLPLNDVNFENLNIILFFGRITSKFSIRIMFQIKRRFNNGI